MYYCGRRIETVDHSYGPEVREHFLLMYCVQGKAPQLLIRLELPIRFIFQEFSNRNAN